MLVVLLLVATAVSVALWFVERDTALPYESIAIFAVVLLNATMGFIQESRAEAAVTALRALSASEASVIRDGERRHVAAAELVPGDVILIEQGDTVPADARVTESTALMTAEAALTGESLPVSKNSAPIAGDAAVADRENMSEWRTFRSELTAPRSDVIVLLATFLLTVLVDLTVAIEVGMVLAAFLFMHRMAEVTNVSMVTREIADLGWDDSDDPNAVRDRNVPKAVEVFEVSGPFFFGAAEEFKNALTLVRGKPRVLIIRLRDVPVIDSTGLHALRDLARRSRDDGTLLILSDVHAQPMFALVNSDTLKTIGEDNVFGNIDDALNHARDYLGLDRLAPPQHASGRDDPSSYR